MSHQIILTFDLDESKVAENAEKEAGRQIARTVVDEVFGKSYSSTNLMRQYVKDVVREMLEPEKDHIIAAAIKEVVENLHRTKVVKEKLAEAMEDA